MSDELNFYRAIQLAHNFVNNIINPKIFHPTIPGCSLEVDNIVQKGKTILVFEGKYKKEDIAIKQLKERYLSLMIFQNLYIEKGFLSHYNSVRLFYYSFKRKNIVEFDQKGNKISSTKFNDLNELSQILRNI